MKDVLLKKIKDLGTKEEKYNSVREFLQELILQIIDRRGYFKNLAFVGGTALRILHDMQRFSEDLDFSLINRKGFEFGDLLEIVKRELELSGFSIEIARSKERIVLGEFIRFRDLLQELGLSSQKSEKLFIKLEIDSNPPEGYKTEVVLVNKDLMFKVQSYDLASLFASKLHAVVFRKYEKGRDYYDLLWFLAKGTPINYALFSSAASQTEQKKMVLDPASTEKILTSKIDEVNFSRLLRDIRPFLANKEEEDYFKREYFVGAIGKYFEEQPR